MGVSNDSFIMKLNSNGELLWITQLGKETNAPGWISSNSLDDACSGIVLDFAGDIYCSGYTREHSADIATLIIKI